MEFNSFCDNTKLVLGLSLNSSTTMVKPNTMNPTKGSTEPMSSFEPSLTLGLFDNHQDHPNPNMNFVGASDFVGLNRQDSSIISGGGSSFSNISVKREREVRSEESERVSNDNNYSRVMSTTSVVDDVEEDDGNFVNGRKKLRLTKPQSALLEEAFKLQSSLNPKQKQELAKELKLRPRQVEVWFQNRRARTKLKQTEMDFEHIKKCCEKLTDENRRLQKELQELKASTKLSSQQFYMQMPAASLTMCPSCERIGDNKSSTVKNPFPMGAKPHFFNSFTNQSAAC